MTKTITIRLVWDKKSFTVAIGDKVIIETPRLGGISYGEIPMPPRRQVAVVKRILGGEKSPYVEVAYSDPNAQPGVDTLAKFNSRGTPHGVKPERYSSAGESSLQPWVSDDHEAAHAAAQREARRLNDIAGEITATFTGRNAWKLLAQRPNLAAVIETVLTTIVKGDNERHTSDEAAKGEGK